MEAHPAHLNECDPPKFQLQTIIPAFCRPMNGNSPVRKPSLPFTTVLALVFALGFASPQQARADIISSCANSAVTEGMLGEVICTVANLGPDQVDIEDAFAFAYYVGGPDPDDTARGVSVLFPILPGASPVVFDVLLETVADVPPQIPPDFGIDDVSLILYAVDDVTGDFVPGTYDSAAFAVYDAGLAPVIPTTTIVPNFTINTPQDYDGTIGFAGSRGAVTNLPESGSVFLMGAGLIGVFAAWRKSHIGCQIH